MPTQRMRPSRLPSHNATWINRALWLITLGYGAVSIYGILLGRAFESVGGPNMMACAVGALLLLLARKQPSLAASLAIATVWLQLELDIYIFATFENSCLIIFPLLVTVAGLLLGKKASAVVGVLSFVGIPLAVYLGGLTVKQFMESRGLEGLWLTVSTVSTAAATIITYTVLDSYMEVLAASERERARFIALFEQSPDGLLGIDSRGIILEANAAASRLLGQDRRSMVNVSLKEVLARVGVESAMDPADAADEPVLIELEINRASGDALSVEASFGATTIAGAPSLLVLRDVTQRKLIEHRIGHAQRLESVGELAGGIAHDFNNLLTAIGGSASLVGMLPDPEAKSLAADILEAQKRGSTLTRQLLAFARRDVHQPSEMDLAATLDGMAKLIERMLGEQHRLQIVRQGSTYISADASQIEQLVLNLVANARDAMPAGGSVVVTVKALPIEEAQRLGSKLDCAAQAVLEVADTGVGIPAALQAKIFEPFFTTKERGKGTGLGLAAVQGIAVQNKGCLSLESETGRGSKFRIFFPAQEAPGVAVERPESREKAAEPAANRGTVRVLLVDDEDLIRQTAARILKRQSYEVVTAANGEEALKILASGEPVSVVVTDLAMPGINGRELIQRMHSVYPRIPVVYMSGYFEDLSLPHQSLVASAKSGHFLQKPFNPEQLLHALQMALDS